MSMSKNVGEGVTLLCWTPLRIFALMLSRCILFLFLPALLVISGDMFYVYIKSFLLLAICLFLLCQNILWQPVKFTGKFIWYFVCHCTYQKFQGWVLNLTQVLDPASVKFMKSIANCECVR